MCVKQRSWAAVIPRLWRRSERYLVCLLSCTVQSASPAFQSLSPWRTPQSKTVYSCESNLTCVSCQLGGHLHSAAPDRHLSVSIRTFVIGKQVNWVVKPGERDSSPLCSPAYSVLQWWPKKMSTRNCQGKPGLSSKWPDLKWRFGPQKDPEAQASLTLSWDICPDMS